MTTRESDHGYSVIQLINFYYSISQKVDSVFTTFIKNLCKNIDPWCLLIDIVSSCKILRYCAVSIFLPPVHPVIVEAKGQILTNYVCVCMYKSKYNRMFLYGRY